MGETFPCDGCGKTLDDEVYSSAPYVTIDASPEHRLRVCSSRRSSLRGAKKTCALAAIEKLSACPGCSKPIDWPVEALCEKCGKKLDLADEIQRNEQLERATFIFEKGKVQGAYLQGDESDVFDELINTIARAASGLPVLERHGAFKIHVTKPQAEALAELRAKLVAFRHAAHASGFNEGRGLLHGLATGKLSIDEFAEKDIQKARDQQPQEP